MGFSGELDVMFRAARVTPSRSPIRPIFPILFDSPIILRDGSIKVGLFDSLLKRCTQDGYTCFCFPFKNTIKLRLARKTLIQSRCGANPISRVSAPCANEKCDVNNKPNDHVHRGYTSAPLSRVRITSGGRNGGYRQDNDLWGTFLPLREI